MAVHIRLRRMGTKKRPFYRIVAADSRRARDGRFLEILGFYDPIKMPAEVKVHTDKLTKWLNDGAIPSDTVNSLLTQVGYNELYEKIKKGEDVSGVELKTSIKERPKKTRKIKKAALVAAETKAAEEKAVADAKVAEEKAAVDAKVAEEKAAAEAKADEASEATDEKTE